MSKIRDRRAANLTVKYRRISPVFKSALVRYLYTQDELRRGEFLTRGYYIRLSKFGPWELIGTTIEHANRSYNVARQIYSEDTPKRPAFGEVWDVIKTALSVITPFIVDSIGKKK